MLEDNRLLWRIRRGDRDALRLVYETYEGDLLSLAANLLHDPGTAEDVVQDAFVAFVRSVPKLRLRRTLRAYLATAVANRARDHFRRKARRRTVSLEEAAHRAADARGPVHMVIDNEQMQKLREAVETMPYEQREVIILRVHADMKFREIAEHQNVSVKTALSRYRYGLDKLHSLLDGEVSE